MPLTKSSTYSEREIFNEAFNSATNKLEVSSTSTASAIGDDRKTVTAAGTAESLAASTVCKLVTVTALLTNTAPVCVGGSTVVASPGSRKGVILAPGDSYEVAIDNLSTIYIDAAVSGEGVAYSYLN